MANKTIRIKSVDERISHVSIDISFDCWKENEASIRQALDELESKYELDLFILKQYNNEKRNAVISDPIPVKEIIKKKAKKVKLPPTEQAGEVKPEA